MTATLYRNPAGRFTRRPVWPTCSECGAILAENLLGQLRCVVSKRCDNYRAVVGTVPGVDVGVLGEALGVEE